MSQLPNNWTFRVPLWGRSWSVESCWLLGVHRNETKLGTIPCGWCSCDGLAARCPKKGCTDQWSHFEGKGQEICRAGWAKTSLLDPRAGLEDSRNDINLATMSFMARLWRLINPPKTTSSASGRNWRRVMIHLRSKTLMKLASTFVALPVVLNEEKITMQEARSPRSI